MTAPRLKNLQANLQLQGTEEEAGQLSDLVQHGVLRALTRCTVGFKTAPPVAGGGPSYAPAAAVRRVLQALTPTPLTSLWVEQADIKVMQAIPAPLHTLLLR